MKYKRVVIEDGIYKGIYIFVGELSKATDLNEVYRRKKDDPIFDDVITTKDKEILKSNGNNIFFVSSIIYDDDTIETLKKKFIAGIDVVISYDELYLFGVNTMRVDTKYVYNRLSKNGKYDINRNNLMKFITNIPDVVHNPIRDIPIFTYDDIVDLGISGEYHILIPLGITTQTNNTKTIYVVDPYSIESIDTITQQHYTEMVNVTDKLLLMDYGALVDDTIYIRMAKDAINISDERGISQDVMIGLYFPLLYKQSITTIELLDSRYDELLEKTSEMIKDPIWERHDLIVRSMHNIYDERAYEIDYLQTGITGIKISFGASHISNHIPIDNIFKIIHSTQECPLVKYNPGKSQENIYRLYSSKRTSKGDKIPHMSKSVILDLVRTLGNQPKSITIYISLPFKEINVEVIVTINISGIIGMSMDINEPMTISEIDTIFRNASETFVHPINDYMEINGYVTPIFSGIESADTNIMSITYTTLIPKKKTFDIKGAIKCINSVIDVSVTGKVRDMNSPGTNTILRFRRVSNYNDMSAYTAYIIERVNNMDNPRDIIKGLIDDFGMKEDVATEKVTTFLSGIEISSAMFSSNRQLITNSPGFPIYVTQEKMSTNVKLEVSGITSLKYLDTLKIYLDSFIRISQQPSIVPTDMCTGKETFTIPDLGTTLTDIVQPSIIQPSIIESSTVDGVDNIAQDPQQLDPNQTDMMSFLMGMDEDDEDDEDDEEDVNGSGLQINGGGLSDDGTIEDASPDLTGTRLNNPNPISSRLYDREPTLFMKQDDDKGYASYSRMCPSSLKRQPIILTEEEKQYIDKHHPGSYNESIKYKTSETGKTHHYICPRYWSLRDNVSLSEKEVEEKYKDQVIGQSDKIITEGKHIYEFDKSYHRDKKGDYAGTYPGFMTTESHPTGMCIPCCFKQWDGKRQRELRQHCEVSVGAPKKEPKKIKSAVEADMYINNPDSFPLSIGRYGYLPLSIQRFLNTDNKTCQTSPTDASIKPDTQCIVRMGIELNKNQSFIGAIASVYQEISKTYTTIKEMKNIIKDSIDIDKYIHLQNGILIDTFYTDSEINIELYSDSKIYRRSMGNDDMEQLLPRYIKSYENFIRYLDDDDISIDYTYLWDICSVPNALLFPKGLNLIILEISDDDITDNVSIICPPTQYNGKFGDPTRRNALFIKRDDYYEHIIMIEDKGRKVTISQTFSTLYKELIPALHESIAFIKKQIVSKCIPHESSPKMYKFRSSVDLNTVVEWLLRTKCQIVSQVMNYNGKIIGVIAKNPRGVSGYIPCLPSGVLQDESIDIVWIESYEGDNYESTRDFLNYMNKLTGGYIRCKPVIKVKNDELLVAIITETNQLIPVSPTDDVYGKDLKVLTEYDTTNIDRDILGTSEDKTRKEFTNKMRLESNFYYTFRTTVKKLLHEDRNRTILKKMIGVINSDNIYDDKIKKIKTLLYNLSKDLIDFVDYDPSIISNMINVTMCSSEYQCSTSDNCSISDGKCLMMIPDKNLISGKDNAMIYYDRLSDEVVRYIDIREFIINKDKIIASHDVKYDIRDNEILIYQGSITKSYFERLHQSSVNKYVTSTSWEMTKPNKSPLYYNKAELVYKYGPECKKPKFGPISPKLRDMFPVGFVEQTFDTPPECSFEILLTICSFNEVTKLFTINDIKRILIEEYTRYYVSYKFVIITLLTENGKKVYAKKLARNEITIEDLIMRDEYTITRLDIWILSVRLNIPIIIVWSGIFIETTDNMIITTNSDDTNYFFIKMVGKNKSYQLILDKEHRYIIDTRSLTPEFQDKIKTQLPLYTLDSVLQNFNITEAKKIKDANLKGYKEIITKKKKTIVVRNKID